MEQASISGMQKLKDCTGTAKKAKECCRNLIENCAPGGGYILAAGASATEAKAENLRAFMEAAKEYGVYR